MNTMLANAQLSITHDGFAEIAVMESCDNRMLERSIYAIEALTFNISMEWSVMVEAEYEGKEFGITQLFITKEFNNYSNLRVGQITTPIGYTVPYNRPENHLTVFPLESESKILPYQWDQLGVSFYGEYKGWTYNVMYLVDNGGLASALRVDNTMVDGLRVGASGYYGKTYLYQFDNDSLQYNKLGNLVVVGIDYDYEDYGIVSHGFATYSRLKGGFSHNAVSVGVDFGYDLLRRNEIEQCIIPFVSYDFYNTTISEYDLSVGKNNSHRISVGVSYQPIKQLFVKAEFAHSQRQGIGCENVVMLGVAVSGAWNITKKNQ
ncbi:MAG: hypothetical protein HUJ96_02240 [Marinilabiliaceae bacterium]|nr:hypothetical protein [Marinilabiliaceae bacterium]